MIYTIESKVIIYQHRSITTHIPITHHEKLIIREKALLQYPNDSKLMRKFKGTKPAKK